MKLEIINSMVITLLIMVNGGKMQNWFTADTHAYHDNIIRYCNRPFQNAEYMTVALANHINNVVQPNDTLYHLGDWSARRGPGLAEKFREMIMCKNIHFILGNHDQKIDRRSKLFTSVNHMLDIKIGGHSIVLCHYAMRVWNKSHHGAWQLYGHSHGNLPDDPNALQLDVGVDTELYGHKRFTPYSFDELRKIMGQKNWKPKDHHTGKLAEYECRERKE